MNNENEILTQETPVETPVQEPVPAEIPAAPVETAPEAPVAPEAYATVNYAPAEQAPVKKFNILKKWWFWLIIVILAASTITGFALIFGDSDSDSSSASITTPSVHPYVTIVKTTTNSNYGITYGAAFDSFFSNPKWSYFKASTGEDVVEFEGGFSYDGAPATATVQFVLDISEGTLTVYHLSINDVDQNKLMLSALVKKVFESY